MVKMANATLSNRPSEVPAKIGARDPEEVSRQVTRLVPWAPGDMSDPDDIREVAMDVFRDGVGAEIMRRLPGCDSEDPVMRDSNIQAMVMELSSSLSLDSDNILPNPPSSRYWINFAANSSKDIYGRSWESAKVLTAMLLENEWAAAADMRLDMSSSGVPYGDTSDAYISSVNDELYEVINEEVNEALLDWPNIVLEATGYEPLSSEPTVDGMRQASAGAPMPKIAVPEVKPWRSVIPEEGMSQQDAAKFLLDIEKQDRNAETEPDIRSHDSRRRFESFLGSMNNAIQREGVAGTLHGPYVYRAPSSMSGGISDRDRRRDEFARVTNRRIEESASAYEQLHVDYARRAADSSGGNNAAPKTAAASVLAQVEEMKRNGTYDSALGPVTNRRSSSAPRSESATANDSSGDSANKTGGRMGFVDQMARQIRENQERHDKKQARKADQIIIDNEKRRQKSRWFN